MRIILCGYNWAGCKALEILLREGHEVFVFTHESPAYVNDLEGFCVKRNVPYSLKKLTLKELPFTPDIIISIYYRYIISNDIIQACNHRIFNLHPSLLPRYRGCSSLTWGMINGEKNVGFTYHYITDKVDAGNILLQKEVAVEDFDIQVTLYHRVMFEALKDLKDVLNLVDSGFAGIPQDITAAADYFKRGCPHNGIVNETWDDQTSDNFIRAMIYPPLPPATFNGKEVYSLKALREANGS